MANTHYMYQRTYTADVLKGIAILFMIQVHILELFASEVIFESRIGKLSLFLGAAPVAPLFMIVFGYFIMASGKPTTQLIIRGLKIFVLGMLLNIALNFNFIIAVYTGRLEYNIWPYIFGVDILQFAGLSLIIIALFKKLLEKNMTFVLLMIFLSSVAGELFIRSVPANIYLTYITAFFYGCTHWSYFPLLPWLAYPLTGIALFQLNKNFDLSFLFLRKVKLILGIVAVLFFILTIRYALTVSSNLPSYYHHGILFYLWIIIFLIFYYILVHEFHKMASNSLPLKYLKWLGRNVTLIYVIQWIIIGNIATEIYKSISNPLYLLGAFAVILSVSSGLAYGVLRMKREDKSVKST